MKKVSFADRLRYQFDNYMSKGTIALIGGLGMISLVIILLAGILIFATGINQEGVTERMRFSEAAWLALMRTLDAGTMGADTGWSFRVVMFLVTLGGVFIISSLIGVLTSGVENKMDELRKGRSRVIESNHTVILGWSPQIFSIISELVQANENQKRPCIVILGEMDKVEIEDEIRGKVEETKNTRIVCRTGSPMDPTDLEMVNLQESRSIIVLAPEVGEASTNADTHTIKTILAITNSPHRRPGPYHIVAEIRDPKNMEAARLVGRDETQFILAGNLIARITAQTCRQSGLSVVYTELLDFGGDEIYFKDEAALAGKMFGDALLAYEESCVIGLSGKDGKVQLNPPMDTRIQTGDKIIAIAQDDDTIHLSGRSEYGIQNTAIRQAQTNPLTPERTLILSWNRRAPVIIAELDNYVAPGSEVLVISRMDAEETQALCRCDNLQNQSVHFQSGDTTQRRVLDEMRVETYNYVIVLSDDTLETQEADAQTLVTLLHLREMSEKAGHDYAIVSEMLDVRNRELAEVTRADDFIVSDKLISLMMSQISENKELTAVFQDLFDPEGSELYLKPIRNYVETGVAVNFYTLVEAARQRGEVALGYRIRSQAENPQAAYGVVVNPKKSALITFAPGDRIIVLAE